MCIEYRAYIPSLLSLPFVADIRPNQKPLAHPKQYLFSPQYFFRCYFDCYLTYVFIALNCGDGYVGNNKSYTHAKNSVRLSHFLLRRYHIHSHAYIFIYFPYDFCMSDNVGINYSNKWEMYGREKLLAYYALLFFVFFSSPLNFIYEGRVLSAFIDFIPFFFLFI